MGECKHISVAEDICYIEFGPKIKPRHSNEIGFTCRGESIIADYDQDGNIIGLELVGGQKPCQQ